MKRNIQENGFDRNEVRKIQMKNKTPTKEEGVKETPITEFGRFYRDRFEVQDALRVLNDAYLLGQIDFLKDIDIQHYGYININHCATPIFPLEVKTYKESSTIKNEVKEIQQKKLDELKASLQKTADEIEQVSRELEKVTK